MSTALEDLAQLLEGKSQEELAAITAPAKEIIGPTKWIPNPGPQSDAYYSKADILLYGGQAAGGKSDLLCGLALTAHKRSLLMRRQYTDLGFLVERTREIDGTWKGFNGSPPPTLRTEDGRHIEFGAAAKLGDERHRQGQPHDFLGMDEVVHFLEEQVRFLMGWVRSPADESGEVQRSRVVFASNPPETTDGDYIIRMFRPWLDITHHNPARPGELRWCVTDPDGKDFWVDGPEPYQFPGTDRPVTPLSRTFIRATLDDNPFQVNTGYQAQLDALPEPLRSFMRDGNFMLSREDNPWQLIPTMWIREAQARWTKHPPPGVPMCCMAIDPSAGGADLSTIAMRYDGWFDELVEIPGADTPLGKEIGAAAIMHRKDGATVVIDMGGGYGGVPYTIMEDNGIEPIAHKGAEGSTARTQDRKLGFYNKRSEVLWKFREALDPSQRGGSGIALPPDQELLSDLASTNFEAVQYKGTLCIKAETKQSVVDRLGRSPDKGDAVVNCWAYGEATMNGQYIPRDSRGGRGHKPKVVTSRDRQQMKRRRK